MTLYHETECDGGTTYETFLWRVGGGKPELTEYNIDSRELVIAD